MPPKPKGESPAKVEMPRIVSMISRWLYCFQHNQDYRQYCQAIEGNDASTIHQLQQQFPKIADLYADWGDIRGIDTKPWSTGNLAWLKSRNRLFFNHHRVEWIEHPESYVHRPGHLLVEIPLMEQITETKEKVLQHLDFIYSIRNRGNESTKEAFRLVMQARAQPKYPLHGIDGKVSRATLLNLRKAIYVNGWRSRIKDGKPLSITETVLAIKQHASNPFGWSMTRDDERALARGTFAKTILNGSEVTIVKRHRKEFDAYVSNTIHARFPDNSR